MSGALVRPARAAGIAGALSLAAACGGGAPGASATSTASATSATSTTSTPCAPPPTCDAGPTCLSIEEYAGAPRFGLRMSALRFTSPPALTQGIVEAIISAGVTPNVMGCNVHGQALFSWLLAFDADQHTLTTGVAKPLANPALGYSFVDAIITQSGTDFHVRPITFFDLALGPDGAFTVGAGQDFIVPIYLDAAATVVVILPMHRFRFVAGRVSADHDCIGRYNADGLDPAKDCMGTAAAPTFLPDATMSAYVTLEEADAAASQSLGKSLCALLTGDGDGASPVSRCVRDNGQLRAQGNWCAATDTPASGTCADAFLLAAEFAASAVVIKD